jgi:hypothetical protein
MRSRLVGSLLTLAIVAICLASESAAQGNSPNARSQGGVVLPITGTIEGGGTFNGLFALQRFASSDNGGIVAVGVISGSVLTTTGVQTFLTPVSLTVGDPRASSRRGWTPAPSLPRAAWDDKVPAATIVLAQATTCDVLNLSIGTIALNVLGLVIHTDPIALAISGDSAGPLGAAICLVLNAVGSIVNLLNTILGLLGGLTGGLGA